MAMCLRVAEIGGYVHEYHPSPDLLVLRELYSGRFSSYGLSLEALVGHAGQRKFYTLD
jgi:hypothetical protein